MEGSAALTLGNAILVVDSMILKEAIRAARDGFAPPPVSEEKAEEFITYLASRGDFSDSGLLECGRKKGSGRI